MMEYNEFLQRKQRVIEPSGFEPIRVNEKLYDFQKDIVDWALRLGKAALFLDCGLGKSPLQLEWAWQVSQYTGRPVLIVAPLAVSLQTIREGQKFGIPVTGCKAQEDATDGVNITNYERLERFDISQFSGIVLDESSILKDYTGKFRNYIIDSTKDIQYKLACTATPAPNDYIELGNHSEFLDVLPRKQMLANFFTHDKATSQSYRLKKHAQSAFWEWLSGWSIMMQNPGDFGYDGSRFILPSLNVNQIVVDSQLDSYGDMLFALPAVTLDEQRKAMRATIEQRSERLAEIINGSDEQWLVWCNLNDESQMLTKLLDATEIKGSDSIEYKESAMMDFSNGDVQILVTKPSIAGHGMNWQQCHNMAFVGLSHSWEAFYQATRRCWRYGQMKPVNSFVIVSDLETRILDNIQKKEMAYNKMYQGMLTKTRIFMDRNLHKMKINDSSYSSVNRSGDGWKMIHGDCIEELKTMPDDSIHLSVFSPPFQSLYVFTDDNRDLSNCTDRQFEDHYKFVAQELYRVTMPGRMVCVHSTDLTATNSHYGYIGLIDFSGTLIKIMRDAGFIYYSRVTIWKSPVVEMYRTKAIGLLYRQFKKDSCRCRVGLPDYVLVFRKEGDNPEPVIKDPDMYSNDAWAELASPVWMTIDQTKTLNSVKGIEDEKHITPLQLDIIERLITLYSNPGDTILSPFAGIGSEGYQALIMGRQFIGIELKSEYYYQAIENLQLAEHKSKQDSLLEVIE